MQQCRKHILLAIDTIETKRASVEGALDRAASDLWVAHALCRDPEPAAEMNDLWNALVYEESSWVGREDALTAQLKDILARIDAP